MRPLIAPADMLASERHYFETSGVPSIDIMENAALALARAVTRKYPAAKRICIACGPGGNGGDGYACARLLNERGKECYVFAASPAKSADAIANAARARECGVEILDVRRLEGMPLPDLWIDCLYGTGLSRAPEGDSALLIQKMNLDRDGGAAVIACDIPSGLNGLTGKAYAPCVHADLTLTFQRAKYGHFLQDGLDACGEIEAADVGFPDSIFPENPPRFFEPSDLRGIFSTRPRNIHKGTCGHLLIIAGSVGMAGAAALCAKAALRSGAGLVSIACPEKILPILQAHAPCAMCIPLPQENGAISAGALPVLLEALKGKTAVAMGPGLSRRCPPEIIGAVLESGLPAVIDADALNIISEHGALKARLCSHHIITPHPGEAARLLGRKIEEPIAGALALAETGAAIVLKGASRVICAGHDCLISASGGCGMARGGSGDILTGLTGGLLADAMNAASPAYTAAAACEIHGLAGKLAQEKYGPRCMNAGDILEFFPEVFKAYVD